MSRSDRYPAPALLALAADLLQAQGLDRERSLVVARGFVEAELLGYPSHGLIRVPANLEWLRSGATAKQGEPTVLASMGAIANWDGERLPGYWVVHRALEHALERVRDCGCFVMTLRRCQHLACVAAALVPVAEAELVGLVMVSSPGEAFVSPFGGSTRLFSNNPLAFTAPTPEGPVLFDISMAITAGGQVARAARLGQRLPEPALKTAGGALTDDPAALQEGGSVMPLGGPGHGHKGHALTLMTEVLSQALGGFGRASVAAQSEENSIFLLLLDPSAFTSRAAYDREIGHLTALLEASPPDDPGRPVRVPGRRAWQARSECLEHGVTLDPGVMAALEPYAAASGLRLPDALRGR